MIVPGQFNLLKVTEQLPMGLTAESDDGSSAFIPYQQRQFDIGESINVFVYYNQDYALEGTLLSPKITNGQFASLQVVSIVKPGAFLEWGIKPDLFLPKRNMHSQIAVNSPVVVRLIEDDKRSQLIADSKIEAYLTPFTDKSYPDREISLLVYAKTPLGYKALFSCDTAETSDQTRTFHYGMLYHNELPTKIRIGQSINGFIKNIREDGKVDLRLHRHNKAERNSLAESILEDLRAHGGISSLTDKSTPEQIYQRFKTSKGAYKKALGALYKDNKIIIQKDLIKLVAF